MFKSCLFIAYFKTLTSKEKCITQIHPPVKAVFSPSTGSLRSGETVKTAVAITAPPVTFIWKFI
jgi:hypothetical protein